MAESSGNLCEACGYDLTGLRGLEGRCPECGQVWDRMSGRGMKRPADQASAGATGRAARVQTLLLLGVTFMILICGGLATLISDNLRAVIAITAVFATLGLMATANSYLSERP